MKRISVLVLIVCLLSASKLYADDQSRAKLAEDLLLIMQVDKELASTYDRIKAAQQEEMQKAGNQDPAAVDMQNKMMDMMAQEMSWDKLKADYIAVYAEVFTDEDLHGLIEFYKTPTGKKFIEKQPELTNKMMEIGQKHVMELLPKMKAMSDAAQPKAPVAAPVTAPAEAPTQ